MSQVALLGQSSLAAALLVSALTVVFGALAAARRDHLLALAAKWGSYTTAALLLLASSALLHGLMEQDRALIYVWAQSDSSMHGFYVAAAFWGGQQGSLLFWAATLALSAAAAVWQHPWPRPQAPLLSSMLALFVLFFCALVLFFSNPFDTFELISPPTDGRGLNPQLQTLAMLLHPPALLLGYVLVSIPSAMLLVTFLQGRLPDEQEHRSIRRWALAAWLQLSIGLVLGMWWAYTELGWGGYWAWDPVENAALIPWLSLTAYLHVNALGRRRHGAHLWASALLMLTFLLTIFGTFLTRSGFVSSIHAFARSEIGYYFLAFIVALGVSFIALLVWRWRGFYPATVAQTSCPLGAWPVPPTSPATAAEMQARARQPHDASSETASSSEVERSQSPNSAAILSRENALLFASILLLLLALVVLVGTLAPKFHEMLFGDELSLGAPWFNRWLTPLSLILMASTGTGMLFSWRKTSPQRLWRRARMPILLATLTTASAPLAWTWWRFDALEVEPSSLELLYVVIAFWLAAFTTVLSSSELYSSWSRRRIRSSASQAFLALWTQQARRTAGSLIHVGMAWMIFGFAGAAFRVETQRSAQLGEQLSVGGYELRFVGVRQHYARDKAQVFAQVEVSRDGQLIETLEPARFAYYASNMATGETDLRSTPMEDMYLNLLEIDPQGESVLLLAVVSPFTWWIWLGSLLIMLVNVVLLLIPERRETAPSSTQDTTSDVLDHWALGPFPQLLEPRPSALAESEESQGAKP
ncbi:MAG: cytochrome c-type biogenesis CcmF C-terminal domain-containing protein [Myxococcota bacterium]|jgi:cytochrome c-type biogenesis protein CcmF|nr:cytochrome c-type biogenesis CcmF C-terminal domain-containing protein [Myxococcota bacterium]